MKNYQFALAGMAAVMLGGAASADYTGASISNLGSLVAGSTTYQVELTFDAPDDQLLAVGGLPGVGMLSFSSTSALMNDGASAFAGTKDEDFAQAPISTAWDSWLTIGSTGFAGNDTDYSPGFAGSNGVDAVVLGMSFSEVDGGYFDSNPVSVIGGVGNAVIAQFTIADGADFTFGAVISWVDDNTPNGEVVNSLFEVTTVVVPAPGAFALLGLAGLATRRRRG